MKTINKYVDEISGRQFDTAEKAIESEKKNGGIKKLFAFWVDHPKDKHCEFSNGKYCFQRTEDDVGKFKDALLKAIKDYEPWVAGQYESDGGLQMSHLVSGYIIGRYLQGKELNHQFFVLSNICPKCFREWGQPYHANHCKCREVPRSLTL